MGRKKLQLDTAILKVPANGKIAREWDITEPFVLQKVETRIKKKRLAGELRVAVYDDREKIFDTACSMNETWPVGGIPVTKPRVIVRWKRGGSTKPWAPLDVRVTLCGERV